MGDARTIHKLKAKICEQAERYDDMVKEMKELVKGIGKTDTPLDEEERNLLSVAYKNVVGSRRSAWRLLSSKSQSGTSEKQEAILQKMLQQVEEEVNSLCEDVLKLLDEHLIPNFENIQAKIFFLKMKGDYYRYMIEISGEKPNRDDLVKKAENAYKDAFDIAEKELPPSSPIRLGLVLNYSVFFYEIKDCPAEACELAGKQFDAALASMDDIHDTVYKDSTLIMQLLRDNLTLWTTERDNEDDDD
ncbi:14-3-3 protein beta/alpha-A-like [Ruditapes philippinarum]|uniref:14-3-3 protein beta/alpha-A-like n=1 Tax=Ruditapes philippinarum TaxID=129788 RepID=UPI00295A80E8|nr:14-3-3 protein beta/alpha-A-like [Ruditapes philippinarum]